MQGDRRFVKELGIGRAMPRTYEMPPLDPSMLANMDPPRHTRIRKLTTAAFSRARIRSLRGWVEELTDDLLDEMVASGAPADFAATYAWGLPNLVVTGILGVPRDDVPRFAPTSTATSTRLPPSSRGSKRASSSAPTSCAWSRSDAATRPTTC